VEFREQVDGQIECFAVDCHPWHGTLDLAVLTHAEVKNDPVLSDPAEMAAWKHYHFASRLASWAAASELAAQMQAAYNAANENRAGVAEEYLRACASAVATDEVQQSLARYELSHAFSISVRHPDNEQEYYSCFPSR